MMRLAILGSVLAGCAQLPALTTPGSVQPAQVNTEVCEQLRAGGKLDGRPVQVTGTYWTDGYHFEYVQLQCGAERNFLGVGRHVRPPESVETFYRVMKEDCERRGQTAICIAQNVAVTVVGILRWGVEDKLLIDVVLVEEFSFPSTNAKDRDEEPGHP